MIIGLCSCNQTTDALVSLDGTHWKLQTLNGSNPVTDSYISLYFRNQQISGFSGCNQYGGQYTQEAGKLQISGIQSTLIGCSKEINDQETVYDAALTKVISYSYNNGKLTCADASGKALLVFQKLPEYAENPADLINTKWRPVSVGGQNIATDMTFTLNFDDKGTMSGIDGPFTYAMQYQAQADNITITGVTATRVTDSTAAEDEEAATFNIASSMIADYRLVNGQLQLFSMRGDKYTIILSPAAK